METKEKDQEKPPEIKLGVIGFVCAFVNLILLSMESFNDKK